MCTVCNTSRTLHSNHFFHCSCYKSHSTFPFLEFLDVLDVFEVTEPLEPDLLTAGLTSPFTDFLEVTLLAGEAFPSDITDLLDTAGDAFPFDTTDLCDTAGEAALPEFLESEDLTCSIGLCSLSLSITSCLVEVPVNGSAYVTGSAEAPAVGGVLSMCS